MRKIDKNEIFYKTVTLIMLNVIYFMNVFSWKDLQICPDEMGYWTVGAWINGLDWSSVMSNSPYYGWGYGILLTPLFFLEDSIKMFYGAEILNIILINITYFIFMDLIRISNMTTNKSIIIVMPAIILLYPSNIVYSHTSMSEVLILCIFIATLDLYYRFVNKPSFLLESLLLFLCVYSISVHFRNLVIVAIISLFVFIMFIRKELKFKYLVLWLAGILLGYFGIMIIKDLLINAEYLADTGVYNTMNDNIGGYISTIRNIISIRGVQSIISKFLYIFCASFGLFCFGAIWIVKKLIDRKDIYFWSCILGISVCMIVATGLISVQNERIDSALYGRYMEIYVLPIILVALVMIADNEKIKNSNIVFIFSMGIIAFLFSRNFILQKDPNNIIELQISGVSGFPGAHIISNEVFYTDYMILIALLFMTIILGMHIYKRSAYAISIVAIIWICSGYNCWEDNINKDVFRFNTIRETAEEVVKYEDMNICYLLDEETQFTSYFDMYNLQFDILNKSLKCIRINEMDDLLAEDILVVHKVHPHALAAIRNLEIIWENERFYLVTKKK